MLLNQFNLHIGKNKKKKKRKNSKKMTPTLYHMKKLILARMRTK